MTLRTRVGDSAVPLVAWTVRMSVAAAGLSVSLLFFTISGAAFGAGAITLTGGGAGATDIVGNDDAFCNIDTSSGQEGSVDVDAKDGLRISAQQGAKNPCWTEEHQARTFTNPALELDAINDRRGVNDRILAFTLSGETKDSPLAGLSKKSLTGEGAANYFVDIVGNSHIVTSQRSLGSG